MKIIRVVIKAVVGIAIACALVLMGALFIEVFSLNAASPEEGAKNAKPIIQALEVYKTNNNTYPEHLEDLVNKGYLSNIPKVNWRYEYHYYFADYDEKYHLDFIIKGPHWYCYSSDIKQWQYGDDTCY